MQKMTFWTGTKKCFCFYKIKMVNYCLQEINCFLTNDVLEYTPHSNHEKFNKSRSV